MQHFSRRICSLSEILDSRPPRIFASLTLDYDSTTLHIRHAGAGDLLESCLGLCRGQLQGTNERRVVSDRQQADEGQLPDGEGSGH
jgi:hypothetical protein